MLKALNKSISTWNMTFQMLNIIFPSQDPPFQFEICAQHHFSFMEPFFVECRVKCWGIKIRNSEFQFLQMGNCYEYNLWRIMQKTSYWESWASEDFKPESLGLEGISSLEVSLTFIQTIGPGIKGRAWIAR